MNSFTFTRRQALIASGTALASLAWPAARAQSFDHSHAGWTALLRKHVVVKDGGKESTLRYAAMAKDRAALKAYTDSLSAVGRTEFDGWSKAQQMAFLINAYNAFTVELILGKYPDLKSIKDLGSVFSSPWKPKFIAIIGTKLSLDDIEHETLRARGRYDDPRVHFAVNCAAIGCPALREEAFVAERLEAQLEEQTARFMSDRSRNRYNAASGKAEVSKIFDWYGDDFKQGHKGIASLPAFLAKYADKLADSPAEREGLRGLNAPIVFLDYDWSLNDAR